MLLVLACCLLPGDVEAEYLAGWPQWRGPLATGYAPQAQPPLRWDDKTNLLWKKAIPGRGSSTPVVWGDRIFVTTARDTGKPGPPSGGKDPFEKRTQAPKTLYQFIVLCLDRHSGKTLWERVACEVVPHEGIHETHSYAAGSPCTDGKLLIAYFGSRGAYCFDLDGNLKWKRELGLMHTRLGWGEGATATLAGDFVVVPCDQEIGSFVAVLHRQSGEVAWKKDRDEPTGWSTPLVMEQGGRRVVILNGTTRARCYDLATGELLWQCGGQSVNAIPSPVPLGDKVICMSGYKSSLAVAIPLSARGELTGTPMVAWKYDKGTPYVPSPLLVNDRLYFVQSNNALLTCLDAKTGKPIFERERLPGLNSLYGSPAAAAGRIYLTGRNGTTLVLELADKVRVLATNRLDEEIDASPVLVGKQLYLRGKENLYCLSE